MRLYVCDLGVIFDSRLNFKLQLNNVLLKANRNLGLRFTSFFFVLPHYLQMKRDLQLFGVHSLSNRHQMSQVCFILISFQYSLLSLDDRCLIEIKLN